MIESMFCCGDVRERRDGSQVNLKAHALQLISTLAALIVEPPRADAASEAPIAARSHGVLGASREGVGGRGAGRVSRMAHLAWRGGADVQAERRNRISTSRVSIMPRQMAA